MAELELLARGRTADVFVLDDAHVLRRYRDGRDVAAEAAVMAHVAAHGYAVPAIETASGTDIVMERIDGPTLTDALTSGDLASTQARLLAGLHARAHALQPHVAADPGARGTHLDLRLHGPWTMDHGRHASTRAGVGGAGCLQEGWGKIRFMLGDLLTRAERIRLSALSGLDPAVQESLGQYFTPPRAAALIASMPTLPATGCLRVLDPGAGSGMLTAALAARVRAERPQLRLHVVAVERDQSLLEALRETLTACEEAGLFTYEIVMADFIAAASLGIQHDGRLADFDLAILNPPYGKLAPASSERIAIRTLGTDAPNFYAAFSALSANLLTAGGQIAAITPRSFCNGPYFGQFRSYFLNQIAVRRIHVFESRSTVFADTGVLQENVIIAGTKNGARNHISISTSNGHEDTVTVRWAAYADVIHPSDPQRFIRIAVNDRDVEMAELVLGMPDTLATLKVVASTGRVVDFRSRECLLKVAEPGAVPLIYPQNLRDGRVTWPREIRKAQWFRIASAREAKLVLPPGWYCVIKRFSAKEERRRIVASLWSPDVEPGPVAFENHLNVLHSNGVGLDRQLAEGLTVWLNSSVVDRYFRTFSGHTQVNATDLRSMPFPSNEVLLRMSDSLPIVEAGQAELDAAVHAVLAAAGVIAA